MSDFYPCTPYHDTPAPVAPIPFSYRVKQADSETDSAIIVVSEPLGLFAQMVTTAHSGGSGCEGGLITTNSYDFTGKYCSVEIVRHDETPSSAADAIISALMIDITTANRAYIAIDNDEKLIVKERIGGAIYATRAQTPYIAASHKFLRIREVAGSLFYEWSTDGSSWTTLYTGANPFAVTSIRIFVQQRSAVSGGSFPAGLTSQFRGFLTDVS